MYLLLQSNTPDSLSAFSPSAPATSCPHSLSMDVCVLEMSCRWAHAWPLRSGLLSAHCSVPGAHPRHSVCECFTPLCGWTVSRVCAPPPLVPLSVDRHSGCFRVLAVLTLRAHAFVCAPVSSSFGWRPTSGGVESHRNSGFPSGTSRSVCLSSGTSLLLASSVQGLPRPRPPLAAEFLMRNLLSFGASLPCSKARG